MSPSPQRPTKANHKARAKPEECWCLAVVDGREGGLFVTKRLINAREVASSSRRRATRGGSVLVVGSGPPGVRSPHISAPRSAVGRFAVTAVVGNLAVATRSSTRGRQIGASCKLTTPGADLHRSRATSRTNLLAIITQTILAWTPTETRCPIVRHSGPRETSGTSSHHAVFARLRGMGALARSTLPHTR